MMRYDFGPHHPLRPERLARTMALLDAMGVYDPLDPGLGSIDDVLRVHDAAFVDAVAKISSDPGRVAQRGFGFEGGDNPPFAGMYEASLAYVAGTAQAARAVRDGASLAFGIAGGLHHARRAEASGFCIFNDPAIACHILLERFARVAYIDIDVHHGDGVQWIWFEDPRVLTCSIHQDPRTLYPGTGFVTETGAHCTALNVPLPPGTTGDVWLWAFRETILPALDAFKPQAVVLQMGTDSHALDPLAHLRNSAQEWLEAVRAIGGLGLPVVALGGGGYNLDTVPRMWVAACLTLAAIPFAEDIPEPLASDWRVRSFFDPLPEGPASYGRPAADQVVEAIREKHLRELVLISR